MIRNILLVFMLFLLAASVHAIKDPSAVYCEEMGYTFTINETPEGQQGICVLPDGSQVSSWRFLEGKVGQKHSYCAKQGYVQKTVKNSEKCSSIFSGECAVCVKEDGEEVEVTKLMNLDFREGKCGDGVCSVEEDHLSCSADCEEEEMPEKLYDGQCGDGFCTDEDNIWNCPKDCLQEPRNISKMVLIGLIVLVILFLHSRKRK